LTPSVLDDILAFAFIILSLKTKEL
jgi:hypothetical protein